MMFQLIKPIALKKDRTMSEEQIDWSKLSREDFNTEKGKLLRKITQPEPVTYTPLSDEAKRFNTKKLSPQELSSFSEAMLKGADSTEEWVKNFNAEKAAKAAKKEGR